MCEDNLELIFLREINQFIGIKLKFPEVIK
jgi:hypothetical protein